MISYPDSLPVPLVNGYKITLGEKTIATQMEQGAPRVRQRFTNANNTHQFMISLNRNWYKVYTSWFKNELKTIANWFEMPVFIGGDVVKKTVRLKQIPQVSVMPGSGAQLSFVVEVRDD